MSDSYKSRQPAYVADERKMGYRLGLARAAEQVLR